MSSLVNLLQAGGDGARTSRRCTEQLGGGPCLLLSEKLGQGCGLPGTARAPPSALLPTGPTAAFQERHSTGGLGSRGCHRPTPLISVKGRAQPGHVATPPTPLVGDGSKGQAAEVGGGCLCSGPALGAGAKGTDLSEADESRDWNRGPFGLAEGAVMREHRPLCWSYRHTQHLRPPPPSRHHFTYLKLEFLLC